MKTIVPKSALSRLVPIRCLSLALLLAASKCFAQLNAGSGAVLLIARLESLSVSSDANGLNVAGNSVYSDGDSVSLTTSWAVPANLTTLKVLGYVRSMPPGPDSGDGATCKKALSPADFDSDQRCGYGVRSIPVTLFSQTAGKTRQAASRIDSVHLPGRNAARSSQNDSKRDTVIIVVQAL